MNIDEKKNHRLIYAGLWLPMLLTPVAYMSLAYVGEGAFRRNGFWHFAEFIFPFCVLFCIHHFLLVRKLFMQNRLKAYSVAVVFLLGIFVVVNNLDIVHSLHPQPEKGFERNMRHVPEHSGNFCTAPPPQERAQGEKLQGERLGIGGPVPLAMDFCIALLLIGANLSVALFVKYMNEKERNVELERNRLQLELEYLKAQLNPHFFMNMLNNIHGMVEINPSTAQEMIVELSRLMRYVLYDGVKEYIPLSAETNFITTYVALMRKRYSNKKVSINLRLPRQSQMVGIHLPPLLFIVLIENAFKHGISYLRHSSFDMTMDLTDGHILFHCCNNRGIPPENTQKRNGGIGLKNLRKRLELLYGQNYVLKIDDKKTDMYEVTLIIPYKHETDSMHSHR